MDAWEEVSYQRFTTEVPQKSYSNGKLDRWAEWLLYRRYGNDPALLQKFLVYLSTVRDRILDGARVAEGDVVFDAGSGDGLLAFGALERVGQCGKVIFNDVSQDLLSHSAQLAQTRGVSDRCEFVCAPVSGLPDSLNASLDVVMARAVLIYVEDKRRALRQFYYALKPDGRLSICEPVCSFAFPEPSHMFRGYSVKPVRDIAEKLHTLYAHLQPEESDPMLDFDERDLLFCAERAGFKAIDLSLKIHIRPTKYKLPWQTFIQIANTPFLPTLEEAMQEVLAPAEIAAFTEHLRPLVEEGKGITRTAQAFLCAIRP